MATKNPKRQQKNWSAKQAKNIEIESGKNIFKSNDEIGINDPVKTLASKPEKRKTSPFKRALDFLNIYENRAGKNLTDHDKRPLERAKKKLRELFGRDDSKK